MSYTFLWVSTALLCGILLGAWLASLLRKKNNQQKFEQLNHRYFKGLNYLLNDESDKAIDVFIQLAETSHETFEPQLALGNLYRRKGEVDRAIKLHQALISQPNLPEKYRTRALLAIGKDYMSAGLLDRAEVLFSELVELEVHTPEALMALTDIYQQEQDWQEAIRSAKRFQNVSKRQMHVPIAHYYCELADLAWGQEDLEGAEKNLASALRVDERCARALITQAEIKVAQTDLQAALDLYHLAVKADKDYLPLFIDDMAACFLELGQGAALESWLLSLMETYHGVSPILTLAKWYESEKGATFAADFVEQQLQKRASVRGLNALLELNLSKEDGSPDDVQDVNQKYFEVLKSLVNKLLKGKPQLRCRKCGFGARQKHWQCPSCKNWDVVKPIYGLESE
ncbi:lipopolysaccharide assembly protein LapB [Marinicella rhabdoformis]|uniref:lipopolysaccharide assembly protein LapB n=1 Tax=Marinicella rhabdoformis TaxID=2580566 RepID=UPI0012AED569|nr:lipopolysaccharide assembly protein LapB [Marinicella rhabdoformis]